MARFRKKPVVVEAVRCSEAMAALTGDPKVLPAWLSTACERGTLIVEADGITIPTLEGPMLARPDDWIVRGVADELYPCKPDIFAATFDTDDSHVMP